MATAYVLGTFDDPLEALTDFQDHAILVLLTGAEQDVDTILDRDTECGINDEVPIFFPPQITAKAWLEAEATALLHVHCANPLDCPELDRLPIRSHGCNPPPNCIAEPDALVAAVARPVCAVPTFFPPRGTFEPPDTPEPPLFPEVELCEPSVTFITYTGSGTWCGFKGFFTFNDGITPRYLTKSLKGVNLYVNSYFSQAGYPNWMSSKSAILGEVQDAVAGDPWDLSDPNDVPIVSALNSIDTFWYGQAAYDPSDGCSLANGLRAIRRTNGNEYAFVMQFGGGTAYTDEPIPGVDDPFVGLSFPGSGQTVVGYNTIVTPSPSERIHRATGLSQIGNQLGQHTVFGEVREILGNEHTLFDQLVLDGIGAVPVKTSELVSFNDTTGAFEGTLSAFSFIRSLQFNQLGVEYVLTYTVTVTTGLVSVEQIRSIAYTGTGVANETLTVPIEPIVGSTVEFEGECITVQSASLNWNDFEHVSASGWFDADAAAGPNWPSQIWLTCGLIEAADFQDMAPALDSNIIVGDTDVGECWGGDMFITFTGEPISWHDFQNKVPGVSDVVVLDGGIGWGGVGWFHIADYLMGWDDFQDNTPGAIGATWDPNGGWSGFGWIADSGQIIGSDDFEDNTPGPATVWTTGEGWGGDGWFADEP